MMWRDLTPEQLRRFAAGLQDAAHDQEVDREQLTEEAGFDVVAASRCVARRLEREARRRERRGALARGAVCVCNAVEDAHPRKGCEGFRPVGGRECPGCSIRTYRADGIAACTDCEQRTAAS